MSQLNSGMRWTSCERACVANLGGNPAKVRQVVAILPRAAKSVIPNCQPNGANRWGIARDNDPVTEKRFDLRQ
jgi:hypothetical protein